MDVAPRLILFSLLLARPWSLSEVDEDDSVEHSVDNQRSAVDDGYDEYAELISLIGLSADGNGQEGDEEKKTSEAPDQAQSIEASNRQTAEEANADATAITDDNEQ